MSKREGVSCIIFRNHQTEVLLIKRRDIPVWVLPGGGIEPNETPLAAAKREAEEETGFKVQIMRQVAIYHPVNKLTSIAHLFECQVIGGAASTGDETKDIRFFPINELPKLLPDFYRFWIADALKNETTVIEKNNEATSYATLLKYFLRHPLLVLRFLLAKMGIHINT